MYELNEKVKNLEPYSPISGRTASAWMRTNLVLTRRQIFARRWPNIGDRSVQSVPGSVCGGRFARRLPPIMGLTHGMLRLETALMS